tara:strand:+ start:9931 stop:10248 length:318 start_codon:yes stop_codon:yes gene_type:complete
MSTKDKKTPFNDVEQRLAKDPDAVMTLENQQHIPQSYIDGLKSDKWDSRSTRAGDYMRVASIPAVVYDQWKREGFDALKEPPKEILKRLRQQNLDSFITTNKQVY